jgi:hypothetical protein
MTRSRVKRLTVSTAVKVFGFTQVIQEWLSRRGFIQEKTLLKKEP